MESPVITPRTFALTPLLALKKQSRRKLPLVGGGGGTHGKELQVDSRRWGQAPANAQQSLKLSALQLQRTEFFHLPGGSQKQSSLVKPLGEKTTTDTLIAACGTWQRIQVSCAWTPGQINGELIYACVVKPLSVPSFGMRW